MCYTRRAASPTRHVPVSLSCELWFVQHIEPPMSLSVLDSLNEFSKSVNVPRLTSLLGIGIDSGPQQQGTVSRVLRGHKKESTVTCPDP